ncbi:MAG: PH domain-containing protein [Winogradskyella sp.]
MYNKEEISVSTSKIQNVYIKQNVLQQIINVVSLSI